jgi:hypothetical protein
MAIQYAGGVNRDDLLVGLLTRPALVNAVAGALVAAGWSQTNEPARVTLDWTGQPAAGNTITLDATVYTAGADFVIGASAQITYTNLYNLVRAAHPTVTAESITIINPAAGNMLFAHRTGGLASNLTVSTEVLNNATLSCATMVGGGLNMLSARTPQGLAVRVVLQDGLETAGVPYFAVVRVRAQNAEKTFSSHPPVERTISPNVDTYGWQMALGLGANWRVIANRYQCIITLDGGTGASIRTFAAAGVPFLMPALAPLAVSSVLDGAPVEVETSIAHGLVNGDNVCVRGVGGTTSANINTTVTVLSPTRVSLDGTAASAAYTTGGWLAKIDNQVSEAIWASSASGGNLYFLLSQLYATTGWMLLNGSGITYNGTGTGTVNLVPLVPALTTYGGNPLMWYNLSDIVSEPLIGWGTAVANQFRLLGQMWDAAIVSKDLVLGVLGTFDAHNWRNITSSNAGGASAAEGSLMHVVP